MPTFSNHIRIRWIKWKVVIGVSTNNSLNKNDLIDSLNRHLDWIKSCDTKASIVLAVTGIFLTIFTSSHSLEALNKIFKSIFDNLDFANLLYLVIFIIGWCLFIYGAYCLIKVLVPRLKKDVMANDSLYYFESISNRNFTDFKDSMKNISTDDEEHDLLTQIYINAEICTNKYHYFNKGIKWTFIGVAIILAVYVVGIIFLKVGGFGI